MTMPYAIQHPSGLHGWFRQDGFRIVWPDNNVAASALLDVLHWCPTGLFIALTDGRTICFDMSASQVAHFASHIEQLAHSLILPIKPRFTSEGGEFPPPRTLH